MNEFYKFLKPFEQVPNSNAFIEWYEVWHIYSIPIISSLDFYLESDFTILEIIL